MDARSSEALCSIVKERAALATKRIGDLSTLKNDPAIVIGLLDLLVRDNVMAAPEKRLKIAILINQASFLFPAGEPGRTNFAAAGMLVTLLNWATSTHVKHLEMACVLIDERRSDVSDRVTGNPHVATVEVPLPSESERLAFLRDVATIVRDEADPPRRLLRYDGKPSIGLGISTVEAPAVYSCF